MNESRLFCLFCFSFYVTHTHKWANKLNSRTAPFSLFLLVLTMSSSSVFDITFGKTPRKQKRDSYRI
jgi:predicted membrane chloride channel (bestrophin family)